MICKNCGYESKDGQAVCASCGNNLPIGAVTEEQTETSAWDAKKIGKYILIALLVGGYIIYRVVGIVENNAVDTNDRGIDLYQSGDTESALTELQKAADSAILPENKMNTLKNLGYVYAGEGRTAEAIASFEKALTYAGEESFDFYLISGEIAYFIGKPEDSLRHYLNAHAINPDDFQINNALSLFYLDIEDLYPAYFQPAIALTYAKIAYEKSEPLTKRLMSQNLGLAYYFNDDYENALVYFNLSDQNDPYTAYWLGLTHLFLENDVEGWEYLQKAEAAGVEIPPDLEEYFSEA